jgi:hypothetical protein
MPHLVMPPFNSNKTQTQSIFSFEFGVHRSEEQIEGEEMEMDLMNTPKL